MRAFTLDEFDAPPGPREDLPPPEPGDGELLVRVAASSANPVDNAIAGGMLRGMAEYDFPVVLGRDFAGTVEGVGTGVSRFGEGDKVLGFVIHANPKVGSGSWAELIAIAEDSFIATKPGGVGMPEAGAAALAGVTALASVDALQVGEGDTVLIVGATGGVGSLAVQLAAAAGAHVIATGLPEDRDYLTALGAAEIVDRGDAVADDVRERHPDGVDALLDTASYTPDDFEAYAAALREGGRGASPVSAAGDGPGRANVMGSSDPANVGRLAGLLGEGALRVPIQRTFGLDAAGEALAALAGEHTQGKLAIALD